MLDLVIEKKMIEEIKKRIYSAPQFAELRTQLARPSMGLTNIRGSLIAFVASFAFEESQKQLLLVVAEDDEAEKFRDDCALLLGEDRVRLFGHSVEHHAKLLDMSSPVAQMETLKSLVDEQFVLVISSASALAAKLPPPKDLHTRQFELTSGSTVPFQELIERLTTLGFERKEFVEEYGDFAVRGGILDIFPFIGEHPVRVEFWGDTIESIREFEVLSQRSLRSLQKAGIAASLISTNSAPPQSDLSSSLLDYLAADAIVLLNEPSLVEKEIAELQKEGIQNIWKWEELKTKSTTFTSIVHSTIDVHSNQSPISNLQFAIDFRSQPHPPTGGSVKRLTEHIRKQNELGHEVFIACDTKEESERLNELVEEELTAHDSGDRDPSFPILETEIPHSDKSINNSQPDLRIPQFRLSTDSLHSGFIFPDAHLALFTEHEAFGRLKRRGTGTHRRFRGLTQKEFHQLKRGDFVVHVDYGIGRFERLQKIKLRGVEAEVMKLAYAEGDSIYVNLNFINRVQKFSSQEGHVPHLTKLGSPDWERLKSRARKKVKDIARDLIKLYAQRKSQPCFAFAADTHWQKELEASFMYEDTPDQAKSTVDVKTDMESGSPMDRLICGDVGFGKTEVAVRAAFKAVMNGKQTAILVPTTILAQQHFNTFLDRVGRYGVRVESLSRFRTSKEVKDILKGLLEGTVDIVIGTHRLLSKDVLFKDLGLLVIDEEHRFGVTAKEKLRALRATIDTLTLTATPIPRTLQFSLMGARDLSIINTPPRNRMPIQTEIAPYDLQIAREAILKELHRGGQVYFIHDRINNMEEIEAVLRQRIPEARFRSAHGQMPGRELEKTMLDFLERKFDVLICTKIIESGIDIPSVNTIIINRADRFGLAELYQLRGRVGRSNVQAYAYLLTPPILVLPKQTLRRLQAIQEFTELGSGFNLAMRDMEIRGAGNLLGAEQSGFILEMGFEMYQRIVAEAVAELREEEFTQIAQRSRSEVPHAQFDVVVETDIQALIPDFYIESDGERLDIYRRLYALKSQEEIDAMRTELQDRFGAYPEEVENLFLQVEVKLATARVGAVKIEISQQRVTLALPPSEEKAFYDGEHVPFQQLMIRVPQLQSYRLHLAQDGKQLKLIGTLASTGSDQERLKAATNLLLTLSPR
jgi:transcription-repair coupling factor (superfamily II helicase)